MGELVNLRLVKKQREKAAAAQLATENRRLYGRTKATKAADAETQLQADAHLDRHRLQKPTD